MPDQPTSNTPQGDPKAGDRGDPGAASGAPPASGGDPTPGDPAKELESVRRALKAANKETEQFRLKLKEFEDRDKSELDKAVERAAQAEARATTLERQQLRLQVAASKGLPAAMAARLQGDTQEELEADADALAALVKPSGTNGHANGQPPAAPQPRPDLGQGARGGNQAPSADSWLRGMASRNRR